MFLQTFVQLHILLAAAPALANWVLLCPATLAATPAAPAQVLYVVCQNVVEAAAPARVEQRTAARQQVSPRHAVCQLPVTVALERSVTGVTFPASQATVVLCAFTPFPHAARAP